MNPKLLIQAFFILAILSFASVSLAQTWQGTGSNWGSGWRKDSSGNIQGTGDNWGKGFRQDSRGNLEGTGDNWGSGWRKTP